MTKKARMKRILSQQWGAFLPRTARGPRRLDSDPARRRMFVEIPFSPRQPDASKK